MFRIQMFPVGTTRLTVYVRANKTVLGLPLLVAGETLKVDFVYAGGIGVSASPAPLLLMPDMDGVADASASATLTARLDATDGTLTVSGSGLRNARVKPASLSVEIVPTLAVRNFTLSFVPMFGRVLASGTTEVAVVLENPESLLPGEEVRVGFDSSTGVSVVGTSGLTLTAELPSTVLIVGAAYDSVSSLGRAAVSGEVHAGGAVVGNTRVNDAKLYMTIVRRSFSLSVLSETSGSRVSVVRMPAGGTTRLTVLVSGEDTKLGLSLLFAGETVTVKLVYVDVTGVSSSTPVLLVADRDGTPSVSTEVTLTAAPDAMLEAARSTVVVTGSGLRGAVVKPESLSIEILPREFRLSLLGVSVISEEARSGLLIADNTGDQAVHDTLDVAEDVVVDSLSVTVSITHPVAGELRVALVAPGGQAVALHALPSGSDGDIRRTYSSRDHAGLASLVGTGAQGVWTLSVGDYAMDNVGTLDSWGLRIGYIDLPEPGEARVLAGGTTEVKVVLRNPDLLFSGETVRVTLSTETLVADRSGLTLTADAPSAVFTIEAARDAMPFYASVSASGQVLADGVEVTDARVIVDPHPLLVGIASRRVRVLLAEVSTIHRESTSGCSHSGQYG